MTPDQATSFGLFNKHYEYHLLWEDEIFQLDQKQTFPSQIPVTGSWARTTNMMCVRMTGDRRARLDYKLIGRPY
jgi:hypothetical protein